MSDLIHGAGPFDPGDVARLLERFRGVRAVVVGDVMVDGYLTGRATRVSPEAPVPVVTLADESRALGGAANVAAQLAALGASVELGGVVGADEPGTWLRQACEDAGIGTGAIITDPSRPTTGKLRVLADRQHVLRLDRESTDPLDQTIAGHLLAALDPSDPPDVMVVSDYAKGVVSPEVYAGLVELARRWDVPLLVDPKLPDFRRYDGATLVKANEAEFLAAVRRVLGRDPEDDGSSVERAGAELLAALAVGALVVTQGERGMTILVPGQPSVAIPTAAEQVFDVSGAGDVVLALLALGVAAGLDLVPAAAVGNVAAGIAVRRLGVPVIGPGELAGCLVEHGSDKVLSSSEAADRSAWWQAQGQRVVFTNGCFDLLHAGHLHLLRSAAALGDRLVVAVNSDRSIRLLKGADRPLIPETARSTLLAAIECVDAVVLFEGDDLVDLVAAIGPDVLVKGSDYRLEQVVGRDEVEARGGRVVLVDLLGDHSTSGLVERIRSGPE